MSTMTGITEDGPAVLQREDVLAVLAHDIRSPLSTIALSCDLLELRMKEGDAALAHQVQVIRCTVAQITRLLEDVVMMDTGTDKGGSSVQQVVADTIDDHRALAELHGVSLTGHPRDCDCRVAMSRPALLRVLANLVTNAVRCTPKGGSVQVSAAPLGAYIGFMVHDTGCGIDEARLRRIVEQPSHLAPENLHSGGLGLVIVRSIIAAHGGTMRIDSSVGSGSTFTFTLPVAAGSCT